MLNVPVGGELASLLIEFPKILIAGTHSTHSLPFILPSACTTCVIVCRSLVWPSPGSPRCPSRLERTTSPPHNAPELETLSSQHHRRDFPSPRSRKWHMIRQVGPATTFFQRSPSTSIPTPAFGRSLRPIILHARLVPCQVLFTRNEVEISKHTPNEEEEPVSGDVLSSSSRRPTTVHSTAWLSQRRQGHLLRRIHIHDIGTLKDMNGVLTASN